MYVSTRGVRGEPFGHLADTLKGRLSTVIGDTGASLRCDEGCMAMMVYVVTRDETMQMTEKSRIHFKVTVCFI